MIRRSNELITDFTHLCHVANSYNYKPNGKYSYRKGWDIMKLIGGIFGAIVGAWFCCYIAKGGTVGAIVGGIVGFIIGGSLAKG